MTEESDFIKKTKRATNVEEIKAAYQSGDINLKKRGYDGRKLSCLTNAIQNQNLLLVAWLVVHDVSPNIQDKTRSQKAPLHHLMAQFNRDKAIDNKTQETLYNIMTLLMLVGGDPHLECSQSSNRTPLKPSGYTNEQSVNSAVNYLGRLNQACKQLHNKKASKVLKEHPLQDRGPFVLGYLKQVIEHDNTVKFGDFLKKHQLLDKLNQCVQSDKVAKQKMEEVVLHSPTKKVESPTKGRLNLGSFKNNITPSLAYNSYDNLENLIHYHVDLRLQLAFYLFCLYYNTRIELVADDTKKQAGSGSLKKGTQACHSAIINNVSELFYWDIGVDDNQASTTRSNSQKLSAPHLPDVAYFNKALNSTVELPKNVNRYDRLVEGKFDGRSSVPGSYESARKTCLDLLKSTALGQQSPIRALELFVNRMLCSGGSVARLGHESRINNDNSMRCIHNTVKSATQSILEETSSGDHKKIKRDYIASLLFMSNKHRKAIQNCSDKKLDNKAQPYIEQVQNQLRQTHP